MQGCLELDWGPDGAWLHPDRVVFRPKAHALYLADLHLGKEASFRSMGWAVPEGGARDDLSRISRLILSLEVRRLVFLGDFLHARAGRSESLRRLLMEWKREHPDLEWHLVRGNHDQAAGDPWPELGIDCHDEAWDDDGWTCRHELVADEDLPGPTLAGHLHPVFQLKGGKARGRARVPAFVLKARGLILPSFGTFTGGFEVHASEWDRIWITSGRSVHRVA